jgi:XTP/dITP diphosphohydrolase
MQQSSELFFASSNEHKFEEVQRILSNLGVNIKLFKTTLEEIQSNSLNEIAKRKAIDAFTNSLNGFPGPYSSYAYDTIGNKGIIQLLQNSEHRDAKFVAIIAYYNGIDEVKLFESSIPGKISKEIEKGGWGYDPIFIPDGESKTYANVLDKDKFSHRSASLKKFSDWFMHKH